VLDPVLKAEILVLDDVGSSKPSPWALETVGHILNTRYNDKRVTVLTTNYLDGGSSVAGTTPGAATGRSPATAYDAGSRSAGARTSTIEESLADRIGHRIRSRVFEMCKTVPLTALDFREHFRPANFR
jgi:DNA replication protein DnaC